MSLDDLMTFSVEHREGVAVVKVEGEIDTSNATVLMTGVADVIAERPSALIIDLSVVRFLGSAGLGVLLQAKQDVHGWAEFAVVALGRVTRKPLEVTGLDAELSVHDTLDGALAAITRDNKRKSS